MRSPITIIICFSLLIFKASANLQLEDTFLYCERTSEELKLENCMIDKTFNENCNLLKEDDINNWKYNHDTFILVAKMPDYKVLYFNNSKIYFTICEIINKILLSTTTNVCTKDLYSMIERENNKHTLVFLTNDGILRNDTVIEKCDPVPKEYNTITLKNKLIKTLNKVLLETSSSEITQKVKLFFTEYQKFDNFRYYDDLIYVFWFFYCFLKEIYLSCNKNDIKIDIQELRKKSEKIFEILNVEKSSEKASNNKIQGAKSIRKSLHELINIV